MTPNDKYEKSNDDGEEYWVPRKTMKDKIANRKTYYETSEEVSTFKTLERPPQTEKKYTFLLVYLLPALLGVFAVYALQQYLVEAFYIPSASMNPALVEGERILVLKHSTSPLERGDVVVFTDPGGWYEAASLTAEETNNGLGYIVKRVIGEPGDLVECCDAQGGITINGAHLDEPYLNPGATNDVPFSVVVPAGSYFVLGDNRNVSGDSRFHLDKNNGAVPLANVEGKVVWKVWPFSSFAKVENPNN